MWRRPEIDAELRGFRQTHPPPIESVSSQVRTLLNQIHQGLFDASLNVKTLKSRCRIRNNNISCYFKLETGTSIRNYIESLRLEAASLLLQDGARSVFEVAQAIGYSHPQSFYRAFTRHFHCTPGAARRRYHPATGGSRQQTTAWAKV